jgi:peroxiredoxin
MDSSRVVLETGFREKITAAGSFLLNYADTTETPAVAIYALGMSRNLVSPDQVKPALNAIAKRFPKSKKIAKLSGDVNNQTESKQTEDLVGKEAPLFEMPDVNGRTISLASLRGKYVLVDFWASWCKPCRMENPNVVAAYQQFKDKNFTVLGVSLDKNKEAWVNAIKEDGLAWTHVSDLKQWQSSVVSLYQIEGIPFNVLLDPQGKVIAKGLRGEDLLTQLAAIVK